MTLTEQHLEAICPHGVQFQDCITPECNDELDDIDDGDDDWHPGQCDNCYGATVTGPLGLVHCACAIGQGAPPEECRCGPED